MKQGTSIKIFSGQLSGHNYIFNRKALNLFKLIVDSFWLLMTLKPHHIFGVKSPRVLFECIGGQILCPSSLHVVENVEEGLLWQFLEELGRVHVPRARFRVVGRAIGCRLTIHVISRFLTITQLGKVLIRSLHRESHLIMILGDLKIENLGFEVLIGGAWIVKMLS